MPEYRSLSTDALIDLLFVEEDRVSEALIDEIAGRGAAALPRLREILLCDDYWYEGQRGEFWIELHVVTILARLGDPNLLPDLVPRILTSCFANYDWLNDRWADVFAGFGVAAVEPLIAMVEEYRGAFRDGSDYSVARIEAVRALVFIASDHPAVRARIVAWLEALLLDPAEEDGDLLSAVVTPLLLLDQRDGRSGTARGTSVDAVRAAYRRGVIDTAKAGSLAELLRSVSPAAARNFFRRWLPHFHSPEQIALRARIWASPDPHRRVEDLRDAGTILIGSPPFPPLLSSSYPDPVLSPDYPRSTATLAPPSRKVGRNDPCPCGSGRKFKKCCDSVATAD